MCCGPRAEGSDEDDSEEEEGKAEEESSDDEVQASGGMDDLEEFIWLRECRSDQ